MPAGDKREVPPSATLIDAISAAAADAYMWTPHKYRGEGAKLYGKSKGGGEWSVMGIRILGSFGEIVWESY